MEQYFGESGAGAVGVWAEYSGEFGPGYSVYVGRVEVGGAGVGAAVGWGNGGFGV